MFVHSFLVRAVFALQAFILDDGNMARFKKEVVKKELTEEEKKKRKFYSKKRGVIYGKLTKKI